MVEDFKKIIISIIVVIAVVLLVDSYNITGAATQNFNGGDYCGDNICYEGDGDCDSDIECVGDLICKQRTGWDYCEETVTKLARTAKTTSLLIPIKCIDNDGGKNYHKSGRVNVLLSDGTYYLEWDYCLYKDHWLREYYCLKNLIQKKEYKCLNGCENNSCVRKEGVYSWVSNIQDKKLTCNEICAYHGSEVAVDKCYRKDSNNELKLCTLAEGAYCSYYSPDIEISKDYRTSCCCEGSDFFGCESTDGDNPFVKGNTTKDNLIKTDYCENSDIIIDYKCDARGQITSIINLKCPNGCRDGACVKAIKSDFNGDGCVDSSDFSIFAANYGKKEGDENYNSEYDLKVDGVINNSDFVIFATDYGKGCSAS